MTGPRPQPAGSTAAPSPGHDQAPRRRPRDRRKLTATAIAVVLVGVGAALGYFAYNWRRASQLAEEVGARFAAREYDSARAPLKKWARLRPGSSDVAYYRAWMALVDERPAEAAAAIEQARKIEGDSARLQTLIAVFQARAGRVAESEAVLRRAFDQKLEPRAEVAQALARLYLTTYRLPQAAEVIDAWRALAPRDPTPYLWNNEIASRSEGEPTVQIRNYRAALERDPNLDKARIGLAEQLSRARRFDEAQREYLAYLKRKPDDASALVGLGRNAFQKGDLDEAMKYFEAALKVDPRQAEALKQLAQADLRLGRHEQARRRYEALIELDPFDHEAHYSYAQALKLSGDAEKARAETEVASRLRREHDQLMQLRTKVLLDSNDLDSRCAVARWMLEHGHADEGLKWANEILRVDPNHAPTHQALADHYQKTGETGLANYHRMRSAAAKP